MTSGESTFTMELPYRRSLGPVVGAFLTGLRDGTVLGSRTAAGRVLVPPLEYDPDTGDAVDEMVEVGQSGTVRQWAWVAEPLRKHPFDHPFAWVLVQLDGADTSLLHALDAASIDDVSTGMRVRVRWADERRGHITDIACFEAEAELMTDVEPVKFMQQVVSLDYAIRVSPVNRRFGRLLNEGRLVGHRCPSCSLVYLPPRGYCPICTVPTSEADEVDVPDRGIVTGWTVLTPIQYHGQKERADYALASLLLDGADGTIGQQRLLDIPLDEIRLGIRVAAEWANAEERGSGDDRGWGFGTAINGWRATGEPDAAPEVFEAHAL